MQTRGNGFLKFVFNISDIAAANIEVIDFGTIAYFPQRHTVDEVDGDTLKINYGNIKNAAAATTKVTFDITFNILQNMAPGDCAACISAKIGNLELTLPTFTISAAPVIIKGLT